MADRVATLRGDVSGSDALLRNQSSPLLSGVTSLGNDENRSNNNTGANPKEIPSITFDALDFDSVEEEKPNMALEVPVRNAFARSSCAF